VTEGRVALDRAASPSAGATPPAVVSTVLVAGNRALVRGTPAIAEPALRVSAMTERDVDERLAWRKPRIEFSNHELTQAVELMNRHNRLQIVIDDPAVGRLLISGTFRPDNPEGFVRIVEETFSLQAERRGEREIVLRAAK